MASENLFGALTNIILPKDAGKVEARGVTDISAGMPEPARPVEAAH
jgi:hypothetical protein